ncbi:MAG: hypothetical protein KJ000_30700 [Pirellulaceae bacterium]|nr:hypothetical protein [Pirellulaceae bacterium]
MTAFWLSVGDGAINSERGTFGKSFLFRHFLRWLYALTSICDRYGARVACLNMERFVM